MRYRLKQDAILDFNKKPLFLKTAVFLKCLTVGEQRVYSYCGETP